MIFFIEITKPWNIRTSFSASTGIEYNISFYFNTYLDWHRTTYEFCKKFMRLWSYFVTQILDTTSLQTNTFYETWFFGVTKSESLLQKYKNTVTFSTKKSVNVYEFFDMFDYTRRMGLTTDIFSFLFKVESQLKYHDLEINEKLQSSESFQFLWWNCLIRQNETKYAVFSKKRKEKQTNKPQWQLNMSSVARSGWLFVQFGSWVDLKVGSQNLHGGLNSYIPESWSN